MGIDVAATYTRYGGMVHRRCLSMLRTTQGAEDATQEVFVRLLRHQARLDDRALGGLLFRMATQVCLTRLRSRRRRPEHADDALLLRIAALDDMDGLVGARQLLDRLFGREPADVRLLATLHLVDGMTLEEVAAEVGLSVSGVRYHLRRLRGRLAELEVEHD